VVAQTLPPMVGHFVKREEPWRKMCSIFLCDNGTIPLDRQIIMVLSGMGGLGKTQLVLHFAREFRNM
jgi:Mrp family chromosome partitioning ATPase